MPGTRTGGLKARETNIERYGVDFYKRIGSVGGHKGSTGGFASDDVGADGLTGRQRASVAGKKGGEKSRRRKRGEQWSKF